MFFHAKLRNWDLIMKKVCCRVILHTYQHRTWLLGTWALNPCKDSCGYHILVFHANSINICLRSKLHLLFWSIVIVLHLWTHSPYIWLFVYNNIHWNRMKVISTVKTWISGDDKTRSARWVQASFAALSLLSFFSWSYRSMTKASLEFVLFYVLHVIFCKLLKFSPKTFFFIFYVGGI